ncbi:MAG TPA: hypothetical protein VGG03_03995 [Thermoanaerobaculia bacterium]|jgi:hypothetical protein
MKSFSNCRHRNVLAAVLLLLPVALPQARKPATAGGSPGGKLDIRILVTAEPDKVFHPTKGPDGKFSEAQPVKVAPRGKLIAAVVFFKDCKPDAAGNCNVDLDLQGVDPRGAMFENRKGAELWRNKPAPHPGLTQIGAAYMKIQIEPRDPAGTYRILAVAHDRNSRTDARAEASFEVR